MSYRIGVIQPNIVFGDVEGNMERLLKLVNALREWDLLVLPELTFTGYVFESREEAIEYGKRYMDESLKWMENISGEYGGGVVAGFVEHVHGKVFNSAAIAVDGEIKGVYRKIHLFYKEKEWFDPGDKEPFVVDVGKARVGIMICYDWMFPEVARILSLEGADVIAHPANLVYGYAYTAMKARAIENLVYVATVNRVGRDNRAGMDITFKGGSQIVSPKMEVLYRAGDGEEAGVVDIDLSLARDKRYTKLNHVFKDRRIELYKRLLKP